MPIPWCNLVGVRVIWQPLKGRWRSSSRSGHPLFPPLFVYVALANTEFSLHWRFTCALAEWGPWEAVLVAGRQEWGRSLFVERKCGAGLRLVLISQSDPPPPHRLIFGFESFPWYATSFVYYWISFYLFHFICLLVFFFLLAVKCSL
jgi:hypothetical protein